jgi:DNA modification methylase
MAKNKTEKKIEVVYLKLNELLLNFGNPRKIQTKKKEELKRSLEKFGDHDVIKIDEKNQVISGNQRVQAMLALKMNKPVLCKKLIGYSKKELMSINIKSNEHSGEWDYEKLNDWMIELKDFDKDFDIKDELDKKKIEDEIPIVKKTIIRQGDLYKIGNHYLLCGDATKEESFKVLLKDNKIDMIFTDPPYSVNFSKKAKEILRNKRYCKIKNDEMSTKKTAETIWKPAFKNMYDYSRNETSYYMTMPQGGDQMMMMMMMMMSENWLVKHELIWVKEAPVFSMGRLNYDYKHEPIMYGWKKRHNFYGKGLFNKSVWDISRKENKLHPTMKPVELIENAILNSSKEKDIIFDCFAGSGSTLISSEKNNRISYNIEIDEHYCQVIIDRYKKYTGKNDVKLIGNYSIKNTQPVKNYERTVKNGK